MPITLHWDADSENTAIAVFEGAWNWHDANLGLDEFRQMTADYAIANLIVDNHRTQARHGDIIGNIRKLVAGLPRNAGFITLVRTTTVTRMMLDVLKHAGLGRNIVFVQSVNEAREQILRLEN